MARGDGNHLPNDFRKIRTSEHAPWPLRTGTFAWARPRWHFPDYKGSSSKSSRKDWKESKHDKRKRIALAFLDARSAPTAPSNTHYLAAAPAMTIPGSLALHHNRSRPAGAAVLKMINCNITRNLAKFLYQSNSTEECSCETINSSR